MGRQAIRRWAGMIALVAVASASMVLVAAAPASACSCIGYDDAQAFDAADAVFVGTLEERGEPADPNYSASPVTLTFRVDRAYKGDIARTQPVVISSSDSSCGLDLTGTGPFLVFARDEGSPALSTDAPDGAVFAGLCDGTRGLRAGVPASFGAGSIPTSPTVVSEDDRSPASVPTTTVGPAADAAGPGKSTASSGGWGGQRIGYWVVVALLGAGVAVLVGRRRRNLVT